MELPLVSFALPTYNAEGIIQRCLESIFSQDYPKDKIEVIIVDDDSSDGTLEICGRYPVRILHNPTGIAEIGWAMGVEAAEGEFVVLLSTDNELVGKDWISKMVKPVLEDDEIVGVRPPVLAPREGPAISRYLALLQNPPLEFYLLWRLRPPEEVLAKEGYSVEILGEGPYRTVIGGNGSLLRKDAVLKVGNVPTRHESDLVYRLAHGGFTKYAHVPEAVVYHHYGRNYFDYIQKLRVKVRYFRKHGGEYPWLPSQRRESFKMLGWILFCCTFVGPLVHAFRMRNKGDPAWLYHPFACLTEVVVYGVGFLTSKKGLGSLLGMVVAVVKGSQGQMIRQNQERTK